MFLSGLINQGMLNMSKLKESNLPQKKSLFLKTYIFIIGLIVLIPVLYFIFRSFLNSTPAVSAETVKVVKTDLKISFSIDGKLVIDTYEPGFSISGKVSQVYVKEGDIVGRGQWLATLDVQEAQKNLEKALKDYSIERNDFDEAKFVTYDGKILTDTLKRILEKNQWNLDKAVYDVELKDIALKESKLVAPVSGMVAQLNIKSGSAVSTQNQTPAAIIVIPGNLKFEAYAEEDDVLKIEDGQTVQLKLDSYDGVFPAKLTFVSPLSTVDVNGIASYKISAEIENPENYKLIDGMEGSISFITKEVTDVLAVSNKAIFRENNQSFVNVINSQGTSIKVKVETGFTDGKSVEIKSGLSQGQEVLLVK